MVDPLTVAGLGFGAAQAVASIFSGGMDFEENQELARQANEFNMYEARRARDWSEKMSSTAYQRSREDMVKAGLNPMLMAQQGGASSPGASSASAVTPPQTHRRETAIQGMMSTAKDMMGTMASLEKVQADVGEAKSRQALNTAMLPKIQQEIKTSGQSARYMSAQEQMLKTQMQGAKNSEERQKAIGEIQKGVGKWLKQNSSALEKAHDKLFNGGFGGDVYDLKEQYLGDQPYGTPPN